MNIPLLVSRHAQAVLLLSAVLLLPRVALADPVTDVSAVPQPHHRLSRLVTGWLPEWLNTKGPGAVVKPEDVGNDDGWHAVYDNIDIMDQVDLCSGTLHEKSGAWTLDFGTTPDVINREVAIMHNNGVQAFMLMSYDGTVHDLLAHPERQKFIIDSIAHSLDTYNLDGVDMDIEDFVDTDHADTERYTAFIMALVARLHQRMDSFGFPTHVSPTVIVRTSGDQWAYADETVLANTGADSIRVMVYDQNYDGSPKAGATAPLPWMHQVADYLHQAKAPTWKFLIGLPAYGYDWPVASASNWKTSATGDSLSYFQSMAMIKRYHAMPQWSASDQAPYYIYSKEGKTRVAFYENAASWDLKLSQIVAPGDAATSPSGDKPFGGIAEWALGMEDPAVWPGVRARFSSPCPIYGVIGECYAHLGGGARFGQPLASEEDAGIGQPGRMNGRAGRMQRFESGAIFYEWDKPRAYAVLGALLAKYEAQGGPSGALGFPQCDAVVTSGGIVTQQFSGGSLESNE